MERFKQLLPTIARVKQIDSDGETICWEVRDQSGMLLGYAFAMDVPETVPDIPGADEMDKYRVVGIIEPKEYKIINLDISMHPDGPEEPWTTQVAEPDFEKQFIGLTAAEINLSPDGKIDALTEATLSSAWVSDAIRERVKEIIIKTKQ